MRSILVVVACVFCAGTFAGDVYKWVDKEGNTHYGDKPKQGGEEVEMHGTGGKGPPAHDVTADAAQSSRNAECQRKKAQLDTYRKAPSIRETDNLGRVKEYNADERTALLAQTEKQVSEACSPPPAQ